MPTSTIMLTGRVRLGWRSDPLQKRTSPLFSHIASSFSHLPTIEINAPTIAEKSAYMYRLKRPVLISGLRRTKTLTLTWTGIVFTKMSIPISPPISWIFAVGWVAFFTFSHRDEENP